MKTKEHEFTFKGALHNPTVTMDAITYFKWSPIQKRFILSHTLEIIGRTDIPDVLLIDSWGGFCKGKIQVFKSQKAAMKHMFDMPALRYLNTPVKDDCDPLVDKDEDGDILGEVRLIKGASKKVKLLGSRAIDVTVPNVEKIRAAFSNQNAQDWSGKKCLQSTLLTNPKRKYEEEGVAFSVFQVALAHRVFGINFVSGQNSLSTCLRQFQYILQFAEVLPRRCNKYSEMKIELPTRSSLKKENSYETTVEVYNNWGAWA